jgi:hypothetical protein
MTGSQRTANEAMMHLQVIQKNRPKLQAGDYFAFEVPAGDFRLGRVVGANLFGCSTPWDGANLVYFYDSVFPEIPSEPISLKRDHLLLPPTFVGEASWNKGYFINVGHKDLHRSDLLDRTCFLVSPEKYCDENGDKVLERFEPCGLWGMRSPAGIDQQFVNVLGLEETSDELAR